jgi:hypothetical protein
MINRSAILLKYNQPAIDWINEADPVEKNPGITAESVNTDLTVYLVEDEVADSGDTVAAWVALNFDVLFEQELDGWYTKKSLWPKNRTFEMFCQWFSVECHSMLVDTVDGEITKDDI